MKNAIWQCLAFGMILATVTVAQASSEIPANDPNIQYFGRWDFTDPLAPTHSWPGVYIYAEFEGTSIGVKMADNYCYYNIIIDGAARPVFHPTESAITTYMLATGLAEGIHSIRIEKRNETTWIKFSFNGFILDDGKSLLTPLWSLERKIEFIGDSFTSASGNLYDKPDKPAEDAPLTNISEGFGPITARHFGAQYMMTSRSGYGLVMDWQASLSGNLPDIFGQTHIHTANPPWDFTKWVPNLVVIGLGLNDYSGFGGYSGPVSDSNRERYKARYHQFIGTLRDDYSGVKILAVAPHVEWLQQVISEVVVEENTAGNGDVFYAFYPYYDGGYVYEGHPSTATHHKIAERLITAIDQFDAWTPYDDTMPPNFTKIPDSPFTSYNEEVSVELETDSYATVRYSSQDKSWEQMENICTTTGQRSHSVTLSGEHGQSYSWYFRAADAKGNMMPQSAAVTFTVDTSKVLLNWNDPGYDDSGWKPGPASIGYGSTSGIKTPCAAVVTAYFRKTFTIADASVLTGLGLLVKGRDGAVVYLNGQLIERINFPDDAEIGYATLPTAALTTNMSKMVVINAANGLGYLHSGENLIAVEMHAFDTAVRGIAFDAQLIDSKNSILFKQGSDWKFHDGGEHPGDQLRDKLSGVTQASDLQLPETATLWQNYPNPFNPATTIVFSLAAPERVLLKVFTATGEEVATLVDAALPAGRHKARWSAAAVANGLYFYQLQAGAHREVRKAVVLR